jgi:hypothetical protein
MIVDSENIRLFQLRISCIKIAGLMDRDFQSGRIRYVDFSNIGMRVAKERHETRNHVKA